MVLRCVLTEILQAVECFGTFLYLVNDDERSFGFDVNPRQSREMQQDAVHVIVLGKDVGYLFIAVTVDISHVFIGFSSKLLQAVGLAYLSCTVDNQRLTIGLLLPDLQLLCDITLHVN